ncbi:hypothetical protein Sa4125_00320 [Aureimonas sp. SA4125]|uniref:hypothetical protein n=1 Tax=Aureimonas sp. SA4125 TaxID=2826993 RepID=UPI001CC67BC2|nr:hypothetical protein [Aureimonas sp. SA4125]BDA82490.1 hypothetical protein Sa4125_00320 [Aureimonas sp. SA4125]
MAEVTHIAKARWKRASVGYERVDPKKSALAVGVPVRRDVRVGVWMEDRGDWSAAVHGADTPYEDEEADERLTLHATVVAGVWSALVIGRSGTVLMDLPARTSGHAMSLAEAAAWHVLHLHPTIAYQEKEKC